MLFKALKKSNHFSYKTWLASASISLTNYSSLDDVLADELAVRKLMTIHASVDYLASWKTTDEDIVKILSNDICAKWITLRDYALDTLDKEYRSLMESLGKYYYGEWALMPQVPKMTSNTAPYGEASATNSASSTPAWKAFNDSESIGWNSGKTTYDNDRVQYQFVSPVRISKIAVKFRDGSARAITHTVKFVASNDGTTWVDISDNVVTGEINQYKYVDVNTTQTYTYIGMVDLNSPSGHNENAGDGFKLQFYAWAPKGNVPIMTSNTAPYGTASAYQVFDGDSTTTASATDFSYQFTNPVCPKSFACKNTSGQDITGGTLQASNDGSTWVTPVDGQYYLNLRVHFASSTTVATVQFYGRELKVSVPVMTSNTSPWGEVSANAYYGSLYPWKAFNGNNSNESNSWAVVDTVNGACPCYIEYDFGHPVVIKHVIGYNRGDSARTYAPTKFEIQGYVNGAYVDLTDTITNTDMSQGGKFVNQAVNDDNIPSSKARLYISEGNEAGEVLVQGLQFYGLDYSEYDWDADNPRHYLYDHGVEFVTFDTPPRANNVAGPNSYTIDSPTTDNNMYGMWATNATIDLTPYDLMRICIGKELHSDLNSASNPKQSLIIQVNTAKTAYNSGRIANRVVFVQDGDLAYNEYLDVSAVNQSAYPNIVASTDGAKGEITEWWLE